MSILLQEYYDSRTKRLELQKEVDSLEQREKDILYELTKSFTGAKVGLMYEGYVLNAVLKTTPLVTDWAATLEYIRSTGSIDLLQKRLTESAIKARWGSGVDVPGVSKFDKYVVTILKE